MPATQNEVTAELWTTFFRYRTDKTAAITVKDVEALLDLRQIGGQMVVPEEPTSFDPSIHNHPFVKPGTGKLCVACHNFQEHSIHSV